MNQYGQTQPREFANPLVDENMAAILTKKFSYNPPTERPSKPLVRDVRAAQGQAKMKQLEEENKRLKDQIMTLRRTGLKAQSRRLRLSGLLEREESKDASTVLSKQKMLQNEIRQLQAMQDQAQLRLQATPSRPASAQARPGSATSQVPPMREVQHFWLPTEQIPNATPKVQRPLTAKLNNAGDGLRAKTPLWKRQEAQGSQRLLQLGVRRAQTPAECTFISKSARKHIKELGMPVCQVPPPRDYPGAQRQLEQRGAGQNGLLRAMGKSMISFCPIPTAEDHRKSMMKHLHSPEAIGEDPASC